MKHTLKKLPKSSRQSRGSSMDSPSGQIEIEVEISVEELGKFLGQATSHFSKHINVPGFRKGNVPTNIVEEKVGKENLLSEAADLAVKDAYSKIIEEQKLEPISQPQIEILKLAAGNPFIFRLKLAVLPEIKLADYKKIASQVKKDKISVVNTEIDDTLAYLRKTRAKFSQINRPCQEKDFVGIEYWSKDINLNGKINPHTITRINPNNSDAEGAQSSFGVGVKDEFILGEGGFIQGFEKNIIGMKTGETKEFSVLFPSDFQKKDLAGKEVNFKVKILAIKKVELPEINDEFAKNLGSFGNLSVLKNNIKEGITLEKEAQEKQKIRAEILEKIIEKTKLEIPEILIAAEKERLFEIFKEKITGNLKTTLQNYLASIKQDEKTLKDSFTKEAEKRVKNFLLLKEIGKRENISVLDKEIEKETNNIIKNYSPEVLKKIDTQKLKDYTKDVIYNEKVLQRLESFIKNSPG